MEEIIFTCRDIAKYFLAQEDEDAGDLISNLKLQKLVYYAQGLHLALYNKPLFAERIEAWTYEPVVPELYHDYKEHGANGIPYLDDIDFAIYDDEIVSLLNEVYCVFGQFSAWKLRNMTHEEAPWKNVAEMGSEITQNSMKEYFKTQLNNPVSV